MSNEIKYYTKFAGCAPSISALGFDSPQKWGVSFDLETTGLDPNKNQITQIGYVCFNEEGLLVVEGLIKVRLTEETKAQLLQEVAERNCAEYSLLWVLAFNSHHEVFRMGADGKHPLIPTAEELEGFFIDDERLNTEEEALRKWKEKMRSVQYVLGHNAKNFDKNFINVRLGKYGIQERETYEVIDTLWISRLAFLPLLQVVDIPEAFAMKAILTKDDGTLSSKLDDLKKAFQIFSGKSHTAVADSVTTVILYFKIVEFMKKCSSVMESERYLIEVENAIQSNHEKKWSH